MSEEHYRRLAGLDSVFARLVGEYGHPDPFAWFDGGRTGSSRFAAMTLHIVGQQISTAVAFVVFDRIAAATGGVPTPESVLALGPDRLRACGLSRAKAAYVLDLARRQSVGAPQRPVSMTQNRLPSGSASTMKSGSSG
jgi:DNA-3-methyladenine glycosylase II